MKPVCLPEKYEILGELGAGGMGQVYHARDRVLDREVALKVLSDQLAANPDFVQRFLTEARAAASLNHPNIVQIYDFGQTGNGHYLAMELVRGRSLKVELKKAGRFSENRTLDLVVTACRTLAFAHRAGIVHRDIKPDNMMFNERQEFKLVDLGLAKSLKDDGGYTRTGQSLGTPHFISPEQIMGARVIDARADVYSLGATMYNLATGCVPFDGTSGAHIMSRHLNDPLPDPRKFAPELSDGFCQVLGRMMAKDPAHRYQGMGDLEKDLVKLKDGNRPDSIDAVPTGVQATVFKSSSGPPSEISSAWDEKSLERVTLKLAEHVGPLAKVLVKKAAAQASRWDDIGRELAGNIQGEPQRADFLRACQKIGEGGGTTALESLPSDSGAMTQPVDSGGFRTMPMDAQVTPAFTLDGDQIARVVGLLADRIGPVAGVLVGRESKKAASLSDLTDKLARSIPDETDRRSFTRAMESLG